ncbi:MAG: ISAzo13 family transposase, partial [Bacteroidetes bacterium]
MYIERLDLKKKFFESLNEADRRRFAALEALNLGRGGFGVVSEFFEISIKTIHQG